VVADFADIIPPIEAPANMLRMFLADDAEIVARISPRNYKHPINLFNLDDIRVIQSRFNGMTFDIIKLKNLMKIRRRENYQRDLC
jgi:translation initiation factor IF-1